MAEVKPFVWGTSGVELLQSGDTLAGVSAGGGDLSLVATATVSSPVATVEFTGLDGTYYKYIVEYYGVDGTTSAALLCQVQAAATWQTGGYLGVFSYLNSGTPSGNGSDNNAVISFGCVITTSSKLCGNLSVSNLADATNPKILECSTKDIYLSMYKKQYYHNSYSAVTGLRFILSAGNIASGVFKLYGLKA